MLIKFLIKINITAEINFYDVISKRHSEDYATNRIAINSKYTTVLFSRCHICGKKLLCRIANFTCHHNSNTYEQPHIIQATMYKYEYTEKIHHVIKRKPLNIHHISINVKTCCLVNLFHI